MPPAAASSAAAAIEDVTDPTDWATTLLPALQRLDNSLRCQVCKEFLSAPLMTECSHTFCSLCIRRCLTQEQKCPSCREPGQEARLRRNAGVEECVEAFQEVRGELLRLLRKRENAKEREEQSGLGRMEEEDGERSPKRRRREELRRTGSGVRYVVKGIGDGDMDIADEMMYVSQSTATPGPGEVPKVVQPEPEPERDDGLRPCPVCNVRMKMDRIPYHLDACLKAQEEGRPPPPPPAASTLSQSRITRSSQLAHNNSFSQPSSRTMRSGSSNTPTPQPSTVARLPKPNYSLMKDKTLREKLSEFGLHTTGTKKQMIARHSEWVNLYNANLDSLKPKSNRALVQELVLWEKTVGKDQLAGGGGVVGPGAGGERRPTKLPGWSDEGWQREHEGMFGELVRRAREGAKAKKKAEDRGKTVESDTPGLAEPDEGEAETAENVNGSPPTPHPREIWDSDQIEAYHNIDMATTPDIFTPMPTPYAATTTAYIPNPNPNANEETTQPPTRQISQLDLQAQPHHQAQPQSPPSLLPPSQQIYQSIDEDPYAIPPSSQNYKSSPASSSQPLYPYFHSSQSQVLPLLQPPQPQPQPQKSPSSSLYTPIPHAHTYIYEPAPPPQPQPQPHTRTHTQPRTRETARPVGGKRTRSQMERENSGGAAVGVTVEQGSSQGMMRID